MRKFYLLLLALTFFSYSYSQVSVTATSGTLGPTAYTTLKSAFEAINAGTHKGVVTISLTSTTVETASAILNGSGTGAASYTSISIQPIGGNVCSITGDIAEPLIDLDGADNVSINGLNTGGNSLTILNSNTGSSATTVRFINDANGNTITNATILGAGSSISLGTIIFSTGLTTGNDNNTISNCNIADAAPNFPVNAIISTGSGTAGLENNNNTISGNNISNYFSASLASTALLIGVGNTDWTITNNKFFQSAPLTYTTANTHRVIQVNSGVNHLIAGNTIGYANTAGTGVYTMGGAVANKFVAIELNVGTTVASSVQNNRITNISLVTTSNASATTLYGVWCGIYIIGGNVNLGNVTANTIGSTTGTGNIVISPTVNGAFVPAISSSSTGVVNISNNVIGAIDLTPSGVNAGTLAGMIISGTGGTITINNNVIGNTTANNMRIGAAGTTTQSGIIRGIINSNTGTVNITNNIMRNMVHNGTASTTLVRGIEYQAGTGSISKNTLSNISGGGGIAGFSTQAGIGILISSTSTGILVDSNTINNLSLTNAGTTAAVISGIYAGVPSTTSGITNGLTITRNRIYNLSNANVSTSTTAPAAIVGIYCGNSNSANPLTIANNMIALGNGESTNTAVIGIHSHHAAAQNYTARIYHNTVDIEGNVGSGAQPSFAYYRGDFSSTSSSVPTVDIKNNIFINNRTGGSGKHYAIANGYPNAASSATGWASAASNYNVLQAAAATIGFWNTDLDFSTWQSTSSGDANSSTVGTITFMNAPADLHIRPATSAPASNAGTPIAAVTNDIDNETRSASTPDIGADEFAAVLSITMEYFSGRKELGGNLLSWKASCSAATTFDIQRSADGKNFRTIGMINATKERCAIPFDFTDASPADGINYYRLKMTEVDGHSIYSAIIAIINKTSGVKIVSLNPTIVKHTSVLQISSAQESKLSISIVDLNGKLVQRSTINVIAGSNTKILDLNQLSAGGYVLSVIDTKEGTSSSIQFIKQ